AKVRHSLELLRRERQSAQRVVDVTQERASIGLELPIEVTRVQLAGAQIEQQVAQLEGQEEALEGELHKWMGVPADQRIEVAAEELPPSPEIKVAELIDLAVANNPELKLAEAERHAREQRLKGELGGNFPTLDLVGQYSLLSRINNYDEFFKRFQRHNLNVGVQVRFPVFSARTSSAVALARTDLSAAELELKNKRSDLEIDVRRQARRTRELDAGREVARLKLQLAQENLRVLQAQFEEGRAGLRDLEKARLEESEKWMEFLEADYGRQRAQLELMKTTGQLARLLQ
ncbi:MAG TPA: TolC family protein, partial [Candidatus Acidoferrales bacterium]|nr:TolC family protein [Candidatus Acidoferrales bacterium]